MMRNIKIMAFDMDGTLLTSDKRLTEENRQALLAAHESGIEIIPATGRFIGALPEEVKELGIVNYAITINGSYVYDFINQNVISSNTMSSETALGIMRYLDGFNTVYDCYHNNAGWMSQSMWDRAGEFAVEPYLGMIRRRRTPVPDIKAFVADGNKEVQKVQYFSFDKDLLYETTTYIRENFPQCSVTSAIKTNVEITDHLATKGNALKTVASYLGVPLEETMAFGDGANDYSLLCSAGLSVAMENGRDMIKEIADIIAPDCDHSGCAEIINKLLNGRI